LHYTVIYALPTKPKRWTVHYWILREYSSYFFYNYICYKLKVFAWKPQYMFDIEVFKNISITFQNILSYNFEGSILITLKRINYHLIKNNMSNNLWCHVASRCKAKDIYNACLTFKSKIWIIMGGVATQLL